MDLLVEDVDELDVMHDESEAMIGRVRDGAGGLAFRKSTKSEDSDSDPRS